MTTIHQYRQQKRKHDENESATSSQEERSQKKNAESSVLSRHWKSPTA